MATMTFDTLKFANRLKSAGVSSAHAEAEADQATPKGLRPGESAGGGV